MTYEKYTCPINRSVTTQKRLRKGRLRQLKIHDEKSSKGKCL